MGDEALPSSLGKADVNERANHGVAQVLGCQALQLIVKGEAVHQHRPSNIRRVGGQPTIMFFIELLRECTLARFTRDVAADSGHIHRLSESSDDLLPDGFVAGVYVMEVDCGG